MSLFRFFHIHGHTVFVHIRRVLVLLSRQVLDLLEKSVGS
jgi:DNA-binding CsgD family transcriptional regulator